MIAKHAAVSIALVATAALAMGCGIRSKDSSHDDEVAEIQSALEADDGMIDTSSEAPNPADYLDIDELTVHPDAVVLPSQPSSRILTVLMIWGHLPKAPDGVDPATSVNWSGSIQVDGGVLRVDRTIRFDAGDRVLDRPDPSSVSFVSHTLPAVDGMLLHVLQQDPTATLTFDTQATKFTIDLASVSGQLSGVQRLDDDINGVAFVAYANRPGCNDGFLFGRYRNKGAGVGKFHMRVYNDQGDDIGRLRGIYGHAPHKNQDLFFGKYISPEGEFHGRVKGTYGDSFFEGLWRYDHATAGGLGGRYWEGREAIVGRGIAMGRWSEKCDAAQ